MRPLRRWPAALIAGVSAALAASTAAQAGEGVIDRSENVEAQLVSAANAVAPGEDVQLALRLRMDPHWHTYWRNPGDAGEPTRIDWDLPEGFEAGDLTWPAPHALPFEGVLTNYGYEGEILLPVTLSAPVDLAVGTPVTISAHATWLECEDICIPGDADLAIELQTVEGSAAPDRRWAGRIAETIEQAPRPEGLSAGLERADDGRVELSITGDALAPLLEAGGRAEPHFFPFDGSMLDHNAAQPAVFGSDGLLMTLTPAFGLRDALVELAGVLVFETGGERRAIELTAATEGAVEIGAVGAAGGGGSSASGGGGSLSGALDFFSGGGGLIGLIIGGFLGGLILNLMPCVFPVLSIKAFGFAKRAHDHPGEVRRHGLVFLAGVLVSFLALGGLLAALQASGASAGWGFQLQNPLFVTALAMLMFAIGLNLIGAFEIGGGLQNVGGGLAARGGDVGAFFTGVLAVIVATPCTAPFMAGALGFALTQPAYVSLITFAAIGLGLAAPFVVLSFAPGLLRMLPKPGAWMDAFRQFLAFPMFLTAVWLVWVLARQSGAEAVLAALAAMTALAFLIWAFRQARSASGLGALIGRAAAALVFIAAITGVALTAGAPSAQAIVTAEEEAWSPERVAALRAEGRSVFVDFTAAWCITCQFNKRVALTRRSVQDAFTENDVVFLTADWTSRDALIADELARYGRSGVPLYLLFAPEGDPLILPQLLTESIVIDAVNRVSGE